MVGSQDGRISKLRQALNLQPPRNPSCPAAKRPPYRRGVGLLLASKLWSFLVSAEDYDEPNQAFREWVLEQARFLESRITAYNATHARALTIDDVKRRFFQEPPNTETAFLLTYTLARLMRLGKLPIYTTNNPFAGQLQLN